ncbi:MAG: HDOD domain-containing protein [Planctomycetota bacterium]
MLPRSRFDLFLVGTIPQHTMVNARVKQLLSQQLTLPTLPAVVQQVNTLLQNAETGTREIAHLIAQDPPLAAKVLKIANSSFYGLRVRCISTENASAVLGTKVLRNVVMQAAVIAQFDHLKSSGFDLDELWRHSIVTGQVASFLAKRSRRPLGVTADEAYTCGLLHDLGKLVILGSLRAEFLSIMQRANSESLPVQMCEQQKLGFDHSDVGALLALQWGLPPAVCGAIQYHHGPREAVESDILVSLIANVNLLVTRAMDGNLAAAANTIDAATARFLGITIEDATDAVTFVEKSISTVEV